MVIDPNKPDTWRELSHAQLTSEGQRDVEEKLSSTIRHAEKLRGEVAEAERLITWYTSVKLCNHSILQKGDQYKCRLCKFVWFESNPYP